MGLSTAALAIIAVIAGSGLFAVLESRRQAAMAPAVQPTTLDEDAPAAALPPLLLPAAPTDQTAPPAPALAEPPRQPILNPYANTSRPAYARVVRSAEPAWTPPPPVAPAYDRRPPSSPITQLPAPEDSATADANRKAATAGRSGLTTTRAHAALLSNPATTVPQGTLIPAVLETAFESTSPGFARAIVQQDIRGFDGSHVLIPRGSRLIGEYGSDASQGQRRAVILWSRLIRPDGVTITIDSPAADTLGRGGIAADVNAHFLARFSGAILQSALDAGVALAARGSRSPVIVTLPTGSAGGVTGTTVAPSNTVAPTMKVPAGRSVGVFVARDLDFTGVGAAQ